MTETPEEARARARSRWPGRLVRLDDVAELERVEGTPAELIGLVTELTLAAWAMRGEPIPDYPRSEAPGRILRADRG